MHSQMVMPQGEMAVLERDIVPELENLNFTRKGRISADALKDSRLTGSQTKQARISRNSSGSGSECSGLACRNFRQRPVTEMTLENHTSASL